MRRAGKEKKGGKKDRRNKINNMPKVRKREAAGNTLSAYFDKTSVGNETLADASDEENFSLDQLA